MEDFESISPFFAYRDEGEGGGHEMKVSVFTQHLLLSTWKGATQGVWKQVHQKGTELPRVSQRNFYKPSVFGLLFN